MTGTASDDLLSRLTRLDACVVSDALDACDLNGVADHIRPLWEGARAVGRAITVQVVPGPAQSARPIHLGARAIDAGSTGSVIVMDNGGRTEMGTWGGLLSLAASLRGIAGVVMDGACRDIDEARALGFPVFGRAGAPRTARGRVHEASTGEPVGLAGVTVRMGDLILADGTGVAVIPTGHAAMVLAKAELMAQRETAIATDLRAGASASDALGVAYEHAVASTRVAHA
jgi:4-hydroxy-4-methyl-2-oxoglutarate aldolase